MNYKRFFGTVLVSMLTLVAHAQSMMTDEQVLEYIKYWESAGKSRTEIAKELVAKGVTRKQAMRVKELYQKSSKDLPFIPNSQQTDNRSHATTKSASAMDQQNTIVDVDDDDATIFDFENNTVFGRNIFRNKKLNFAPSENLATPQNYKLGPGDEVIVDIFGVNQNTIRSIISPEGSINVDVLGPVYLNGMNIDEANKFLKRKLASIYAGIESEGQKTEVKLSLGRIRSIQINILGDVTYPGTYNLSSFSTVFHALYRAGGIKEPGSLRNITVNRGGKNIATVDVYDFLMNGNRSGDIRLEEGDVILVPSYKTMVKVEGYVKRPMLFELKDGETLSSLIEYAGGFAQSAYTDNITVVRQNGKNFEVCTVDEPNFATFQMQNGDEIKVGELISRFKNRVSIKGAVYRSGLYQLDDHTNTVKALIEKAEGLMPDAFTNRALLNREREDRSLEMMSVDIEGILNGTKPDIALRNNDELYIPSKYDLSDAGTLTISGEVANPSTFVYAENMTLEDLIIRAGGLLESASLARVDVIRRVKDANSTKATSEISKMFNFSVKDNYVIEGESGFKLAPYDEVIVRKSPSYTVNKYVTITGEANFPGKYPLTKREERLSDLLKKAGGATDYAYIKGARLLRQVTAEELKRLKNIAEINDTILGEDLDEKTNYSVAINLEKAIENPNSVYDVVLRENDELILPVYSNTVSVEGCVLSPNEITFEPGKSVKYYIKQAGGYSDKARKRKMYMLTMNGYIKKAKGSTKVEPGAKIIVPEKSDKGAGLRDVLAIATTASSLATMAATIGNLLK
ncbi:MAG: SLBB domain-containing protein [Bacteroidaceae bacterium]|nr:SLBB domain-containing protein [Bacteroidaceae bacterium]